MARLRRSRIQSHFQFRKLRTLYHQPVRKDEVSRMYTVTDYTGATKKASRNEFWVAEALKELGMDFQFQVSVAAGRQLAFGVVLDFYVLTVPQPTPVWVHGEHWHQGNQRAEDLKQQQTVSDYFGGDLRPPVEIWGSESVDKEAALHAVRRYIL